MLLKLWLWLRARLAGQAKVSADRQAILQPTASRSSPRRPSRASFAENGYLALLEAEVQTLPTLSQREEQETSELVEAITDYASNHEIDPPVVPALATRMLELLRAPEVDLPALVRLIERDQASSAKLMSIANSAAFKGQTEVRTVRDAIVLLGTEQVAQIAIGLASRSLFEGNSKKAKALAKARFGRLFQHAMTTAFAACELASRRARRHADAAFLGGLFHDVGKAVALRALVEMLEEQGRWAPDDRVIDSALHQLHREPRAFLYEGWELPGQLMMMCKNHHVLPADVPIELHFVRLVSGLDTLRAGADVEKLEAFVDVAESSAALRLSNAELRVAHTETGEYAKRVAIMFK
jgi:HD-like signal output (HDOD) protein